MLYGTGGVYDNSPLDSLTNHNEVSNEDSQECRDGKF